MVTYLTISRVGDNRYEKLIKSKKFDMDNSVDLSPISRMMTDSVILFSSFLFAYLISIVRQIASQENALLINVADMLLYRWFNLHAACIY